MIEIGRTIVGFNVLQEYFLCDLMSCKGACCIEGDSGAPVTSDEVKSIENEFGAFRNYLSENHLVVIQDQGFSVLDNDGDLVTPLVNNRQCVYSFYNDYGILKCAIEKAFSEGKTSFRKPVSCHLFPIRITVHKRFDAVNYQELEICNAGKKCGKSAKLPLYQFLKEPLIRKYGEEWFKELEVAAVYLENSNTKD